MWEDILIDKLWGGDWGDPSELEKVTPFYLAGPLRVGTKLPVVTSHVPSCTNEIIKMHQDHKAEISKRVELLQQIFRDSREMEFPKVFQTIFGKKHLKFAVFLLYHRLEQSLVLVRPVNEIDCCWLQDSFSNGWRL